MYMAILGGGGGGGAGGGGGGGVYVCRYQSKYIIFDNS